MNIIEVKKLEDAARSSFALMDEPVIHTNRVTQIKNQAAEFFAKLGSNIEKYTK